MAYSFSESEFEGVDDEDSLDAHASNVVESLEEDDDLDDDQLESDVESRLEAAVYLKTLLSGDLFVGDRSAAARIVTKRVRDFVRGELRQLLGLETQSRTSVEAQFSTEEVAALKAIAGRVLHRPPVASEPQLRKPELVLTPSAPVLRPRQVSQQAPAAPPRKAEPAPTKTQKQRPKPATKAKSQRPRVLDQKETTDGHQITSSRDASGRVKREYFDANGKKLSERDMTPQVRPQTAIPMPSAEHLGFLTEQQSAATVNAQTQNLGVLGTQLVSSLLKG